MPSGQKQHGKRAKSSFPNEADSPSNLSPQQQDPPPQSPSPQLARRKERKGIALPILVFLSVAAVLLGYFFNPASKAPSSSRPVPRTFNKSLEGLSLRERHEVLQSAPYSLDKEKQVIGKLEDCGLGYASYIKDVPARESRPMGVKFRNFYPKNLDIFWDDGSEKGVYTGSVRSGGFTATNSYEDHVFFFKTQGSSGQEVARFQMRNSQHLYIIPPLKAGDSPPGYKDAVEESNFMQEYFNRTGSPYLGFYPRSKPLLHMWSAEKPGIIHKVKSKHGFYNCNPNVTECVPGQPLDLTIKVVSTKPRVMVIENLMSEFECKHVVSLGKSVISRSTVGDQDNAFQSNTRTSLNGWLKRTSSKVLDNMFSRFADVLGVPDEWLQHDKCAEELQVVKYATGQEYTPHHDFGYSGKPNQRFLTLLMYIHPPKMGGGTSFPKAYEGRGLQVKPPMGSAVLFYSMTPDGNADDLSVHAGMPVLAGVKWVCNLWVWDPDKGGA